MKTIQNTTRCLGLALACGIITLAALAQAGKPVKPPKPPPEPPPPAGPAYTIIPIPLQVVLISAIGDGGTVVGSANGPDGMFGPVSLSPRLSPGEVIYLATDARFLPNVDGFFGSGEALAVNDGGLIVGYIDHDASDRAMLWLQDGTPIDLGVAPADTDSRALAINDSGLVAVGFPGHSPAGVVVPLDTDNNGEPDVWFVDENPEDGINDLFYPIETGSDLTPVAINEAGQVAVQEGYLLTPDFGAEDGDGNPWYADEDNDGTNDLLLALEPPPQSGESVEVADVNNLGQVVGHAGKTGLRWELVGGQPIVTDLGSLPGLAMLPKAINDAGQIVGVAYKPRVIPQFSRYGFLIDNDVIYELRDVIVNLEDWPGRTVYGINNDGWIYGIGFVGIPVEQP